MQTSQVSRSALTKVVVVRLEYSRSVHAPIGNGATHASNHGDAPRSAQSNHLSRRRLGSHETAGDIDAQHPLALFLRVVQGRRLIVDASGSNKTVKSTFVVGNALKDTVKLRVVPHVRLVIRQA